MNDEQLGLGCVELVQQSVDGEGEIGRGGNSTEPALSLGGDAELDMVGGEESNTVIVPNIPADLHMMTRP